METSKVKSGVRNQAEAKLNQLEHSESAWNDMNQLQALEEEDGPAGTSKGELAGTSKWTIDDDVITGLAMETSKVKSGVRNQAEAKLNQLEHIDTTSFDLPSRGKSSRKHLKPTTGQPAASISSPAQPVASSMHPVASFAYPVDMVSRRKKSRSSEAWQPGAKIQTQKRNSCCAKCCEEKTKAERTAVQPFNAINAQDGRING
ncbi:divinyl chlorophyllide a 8-vinyl-reductase, chloroplastic-like [Dorcoceras hygrometricum]|uniref:Divinyl chlorophyllide a 8-vinyl-reductase, chloroplastic-like n=1 Tax=Dorcoceras hygrometricum TaxID=472368 RepID=A0A2Z7DJ74_9LAMI|nr:divinyl chlorophyllide a 8-vinyl-reductase, chloroplastic-like [Dorcoceras hygrometricum]